MKNKIEDILEKCSQAKIKITPRKQSIIKAIIELNQKEKHPDTEEIFFELQKYDSKASIATIYRFLSEMDDYRIIEKHNFGDGKTRYEFCNNSNHHDHLIDMETNEIIEFFSFELEKLKQKIARDYGYILTDHRLELKGVKNKNKTN
jgi:Fur family ferric uptake transcriptional regulator